MLFNGTNKELWFHPKILIFGKFMSQISRTCPYISGNGLVSITHLISRHCTDSYDYNPSIGHELILILLTENKLDLNYYNNTSIINCTIIAELL